MATQETHAPIPYAETEHEVTCLRGPLERPLPMSREDLLRYAAGDEAFAPPHWVRLRAPRDSALEARYLATLGALAPLVERDPTLTKAFTELELPRGESRVQRLAARALEGQLAPGAEATLFAFASGGTGARFERLFAREDVPAEAHLLRLSTLRERGGMPWSEAFARAMSRALPTLGAQPAGWALRLIAELGHAEARRFLASVAGLPDPTGRLHALAAQFLANPPAPDPLPEEEVLPTRIDDLELGALDERKPARRIACLREMARRDWGQARRLASSIQTEDWRLDELVGALLNHASRAVMTEDFVRRGLIPKDATPADAPDAMTARELLAAHGKVVRFDTGSTEGIVDHDALAYLLSDALSPALDDVDFLEELRPDRSLVLHAWSQGRRFEVELDVRRSVVDPYGLVGLVNVLLRERGRPERCMHAAQDKALAEVVIGPESELRALVHAGLLWIRAGFRW